MLELHEQLKARLIALLTEALPLLEVQNGMFLTWASRIALLKSDEALPKHGALRDKLNTYIDMDFPLVAFVYNSLQNELLIQKYSDVALQKLTDIENYSDPAAHAARLIDDFQSLPCRYSLSIRLPHEISELFGETVVDEELGANVRLVKATPALAEKFPLNHPDAARQNQIHRSAALSLFAPDEGVTWSENAIYLQIKTEGFIGPFGGLGPAAQAERLCKSFLGLGLALRLFEIGDVHYPSPPSHSFYVHKATGNDWCIHTKIELDRDTSRVLSQIRPNGMFARETDERKQALVKLIMSEMKAVFSAGSKSEPISLAAEWLLESYSVRDERLSYVQSMVVLEVLLGDKATSDEIGLGQLLRNRCAYLIGKNYDERHTILKDFDEIYKVRSLIVHRGKAQLNFKERLLFSKLRDFCNRVIQREVDLLRAK